MSPGIIERFSHDTKYIYLDVKCPSRYINVNLCALLCCSRGAITEMLILGKHGSY